MTAVVVCEKVTAWYFHPHRRDKNLLYKERKKQIKRDVATLSFHNALTVDLENYTRRADFHYEAERVRSWLATHVSSIFNHPGFSMQSRGWPAYFRQEWHKMKLKKRNFIDWCYENRRVIYPIGIAYHRFIITMTEER
jgi:hypothetical protein